MTELTQEQKQTIEDALNTIPENLRTGKYATMEGIEEQLARGDKIIFHLLMFRKTAMSLASRMKGTNFLKFLIF